MQAGPGSLRLATIFKAIKSSSLFAKSEIKQLIPRSGLGSASLCSPVRRALREGQPIFVPFIVSVVGKKRRSYCATGGHKGCGCEASHLDCAAEKKTKQKTAPMSSAETY